MPIASHTGGFLGLWNPSSLSPYMWYDAAVNTSITLSGTNVTEWRDLSGNALHMTGQAGDGTNYPKYTGTSLNGFTTMAIDCTTSFRWFQNTGVSITGNKLTVFSVHKNTFPGTGRVVFSRVFSMAILNTNQDYNATTTIAPLLYGTTAGKISLYYNGTDRTNATVTSDTYLVAASRRDAGTASLWVNGTKATDGTGLGTTNFNITTVRMGTDMSNADSGMRGALAEQIVFRTNLTDAQCDQVNGYLAWKWGLNGNLPNAHAYKNTPPQWNR
jgi:hypothetical protein